MIKVCPDFINIVTNCRFLAYHTVKDISHRYSNKITNSDSYWSFYKFLVNAFKKITPISCLRCADDIVIKTERKLVLKAIKGRMEDIMANEYTVRINKEKTKIM